MKNITTTAILALAILLQGSMAFASQNPTAAQRRVCFRYLKSQALAPAGWVSTSSYAFSHTTVRAESNAPEYVWQNEIATADGTNEAFIYVTTNAACTAVVSISAPSDQ